MQLFILKEKGAVSIKLMSHALPKDKALHDKCPDVEVYTGAIISV